MQLYLKTKTNATDLLAQDCVLLISSLKNKAIINEMWKNSKIGFFGKKQREREREREKDNLIPAQVKTAPINTSNRNISEIDY